MEKSTFKSNLDLKELIKTKINWTMIEIEEAMISCYQTEGYNFESKDIIRIQDPHFKLSYECVFVDTLNKQVHSCCP